jgi:hypothetical protein
LIVRDCKVSKYACCVNLTRVKVRLHVRFESAILKSFANFIAYVNIGGLQNRNVLRPNIRNWTLFNRTCKLSLTRAIESILNDSLVPLGRLEQCVPIVVNAIDLKSLIGKELHFTVFFQLKNWKF